MVKSLAIILLMLVFFSCNNKYDREKAKKFNNMAMEIAKSMDKESSSKAIEYLDKAIQLDSTYYLAYWNKVNILSDCGKYSEALKLLFKIEPQMDLGATFLKAELYRKLKDTLEAKKLYTKFLNNYKFNNTLESKVLYFSLICKIYSYNKAIDSLNAQSKSLEISTEDYEIIKESLQSLKDQEIKIN
jgi:tetratricopeptide (TPR) repeat protein